MHKRYDFAGVLVVALLASTGGSLLRDGILLAADAAGAQQPVVHSGDHRGDGVRRSLPPAHHTNASWWIGRQM
jgi:hypothetical protein